ncbi:IucA/IucC family protein [Streptomyces bluensis]|uniref:IucA/IucC family protein n=1 Tax=Streptomyces bluensis TaxID=33897 RepID=UPI003D9EB912
MTATPLPAGRTRPHTRGTESIPEQMDGTHEVERLRAPTSDLLNHPDAHTAAQAAAIENLLRCWAREHDVPAPDDGTLRVPLPVTGTALLAPVHYWSPTGWHRFGPARLADAPETAPPADAMTVAALLAREAAAECTDDAVPDASLPSGRESADLVSRVADSLRRTAAFLSDRRSNPTDAADLFLTAEQSLVLGHPLHPTPKSREGFSEAEARLYSPESRGSFPLHWIAVVPSALAADSAWTERGRLVPAEQLTARLAGSGLPLPTGHTALPVHPWQLHAILHRPEIAALLDTGLLQYLGRFGSPWHPTSSVRTVYRSGAPAMLKLSLGLSITNSRRENLRKELHRGVEVHRLLRTGLAREWQNAHPGFDIVRDPAWLAVTGPDGHPVPGLDVVIRHNPFDPADDVTCIAGLVSPRPWAMGQRPLTDGLLPSDDPHPADRPQLTPHLADRPHPATQPDRPTDWSHTIVRAHATGPQPHASVQPYGTDHQQRGRPVDTPDFVMRSRLTDIVTRLAGRTGRPCQAVATEWFLRYLEHVVRPVLWLDSEAGIALEAHQQNTLLLLDPEGWPRGGRYRDNQGYYFRESRRAELDARLPGIGEQSDTFVSDEVTDERFAYYLAINNVFGLIGAFGSQRLADEGLLLAAFRRFLAAAATGPARLRTSLPALLLDSPVLRCKANLLTRLHGLDELVGPVDTQSVYVTIANPLRS